MDDLLLEFLRHYGMKEVFGPEANPEILAMFADIGYKWVDSDETAWCSAAMNFFCRKLGYERSGKLDARSWLKIGIPVGTPQMGNIVVYWRTDPKGWEGHVGLYIADDGVNNFTIGGNQSNMININPYPQSRVLGYRRLSKL